jgi:multiple sugar transport system substrate-binding protein
MLYSTFGASRTGRKMRDLGKNLTRAALAGMFVIPGLLAAGGNVAHAASPVTLTVAFDETGPASSDQILKWWNQITPQIESAIPGVKIKLDPIVASEGDFYTKIDLSMRSASTAPDIVEEDSFLIGSDATAGYLTPLDKYLATWPEYKQQWFPAMQSITTFNGHNYGIMNGTDVQAIWYNKNIFKQAGLPTTWQPHSWSDILKAAQTIKTKVPNVVPINLYSGIPADEASTVRGFLNLLYGTNYPLYDYKTNKWDPSNPGVLAALNFLQTVYSSKNLLGPDPSISLNANVGNLMSQQLLPQSKVGIDLDGSWLPGTWVSGGAAPWPQWQSVMGVAKIPTQNGQAPGYTTMSGGWSWAISSKSKNQDLAFKVLQLASSKQNLANFDAMIANIAPRKDETSVPAYSNIPLSKFFTSLVNYTHFRPAFPAYPKISLQIQEAMELVMNGTTPTAAMSNFADAVKGIAGAANVETH